MTVPLLQLDLKLRGMEAHVVEALAPYLDEMRERVRLAVAAAVQGYDYGADIAEIVRHEFRSVVRSVVHNEANRLAVKRFAEIEAAVIEEISTWEKP